MCIGEYAESFNYFVKSISGDIISYEMYKKLMPLFIKLLKKLNIYT